jgi:pimeloyl-ACP methyl ester carboxylesterase
MPVGTTKSTRRAVMAAGAAGAALFASGADASATPTPARPKPTIVLVHGAFAESGSWNLVVSGLVRDGHHVVAVANPLRSAGGDAAYVAAALAQIDGPVVLVGHSYGGTVITGAVAGRPNVKALVYVSAFQPDVGETSFGLTARFPGSTLGEALAPPVKLPDGNVDLYIRQDRFHAQFCADLPAALALQLAATQRPITQAAGEEASGQPAWRTIPSWSIHGSADLNIPPAAMAFMAGRAKARRTVEVKGASHLVMLSHSREVISLIEEAATTY